MEKTYTKVIVSGPAQFEARTATLPDPLPAGYFAGKVNCCSICGSDRGFWRSGNKDRGVSLGHEMCVTVTDPGDTDLKVGERVAIYPLKSCWECESCRQGYDNICLKMGEPGRYTGISKDGGYAQMYIGPADYAIRVPDHVSDEAAALVEPIATSYHGLRRSRLTAGCKALVVGAGPIGLYAAELAKLAGAKVAISEFNVKRLEAAKARGDLDGYFDASDPDLNANLKAFCGDRGFDVVFECSGSAGGFATAIATVRIHGQVVALGVSTSPVGIVTQSYAVREVDILPSFSYTMEEFKTALDIVASGKLDPTKYVTKTVPLDQLQAAFEALFDDPNNADLKVLVKPN